MNEVKLKAEVLDEIISYLDIMRENSQHHQDEYDAIHFLAECTSVLNNNIKEVAPHLFLHDQELDNEAKQLGEITLRELEENRINNLYN